MSIKVVALISVKPGSEPAFEAALAGLVAGARAEPGNQGYDVWREDEGARRYVVDELYADQAAVDAHMASEHLKTFGKAVGDLLAAPLLIVPASQAIHVA